MIRALPARRRDDETGSTLAEVLISVIVNALAMGVIATAFISFTTVQSSYTAVVAGSAQASVTELSWRTDIRTATHIDPVDENTVVITDDLGGCRERIWSIIESGALARITVDTLDYTEPADAEGRCTGPSTTAVPVTLISDAVAPAFSYANPGGRPISYTASVPTLGPAPKPSAVSGDAWASIAISRATLDAGIIAGGRDRGQVHIVQATTAQEPTTADAPTTRVTP